MNFRRIGHFGLLVALFAASIVTVTVSAHVAQAAPIGSQFVPVAPCRLVDTRQPGQQSLAAGGSLRVAVSDRCGVPAGGGAVAVTITATDAATAGYLTAHAASTPLPDSSNVNYRPGAAVANSAIVALSADGAIEIFSSSAVQVIVDVNGVFVPVTANVAAGRFVPLPPSRLADTRLTADHRSGDLVVPIPAGVPSDATALAVSVTLTDADQGAAYVTVYPAGVARPTASVVNTDPLERAKAVTLFTPVSRDGLVLWRSAPSDVIVDVVGWFTGPSSAPGSDGLFVADGPRRVWDSRSTNDPLHAGGIVERSLVAGSAAAAVMNVTAVDATAPGFVTAYPAGMERPNVSMLNVTWRSPLASMSVVSMSSRGAALYASVGVHMIVDVTGWFLGAPVSTGAPTVANPMPSSGGPVLFVSDSSLAGIRWNGDLGWLQGAPIVADLESCRRLIGASCRGREGYAPENATQAVLTAPGNFDTLVIGTGYDDFAPLFAQGFDSVVRAARARGITRIVWFDYRELVGYSSPGHVSYAATFAANNATLRTMVASGAYPEVAIADWNGYSASHPGWFTSDGVHVTGDGTQEAAMYLSCTLAFLDRRPCPAGMGGPVAAGGWCASPDVVGATA